MTTIISGSSPSITFSDSTTQTTAANITAPYTSNGVVYASSTSALATGSALTFDGTNLSLLPSGYSVFGASSAEQMRLTSTGLGIGASSPSFKLDVQKATIGTVASFRGSGAGRFLYVTSSTTTNDGDTYTLDSTSSTGVLAFATTSIERMRIDTSGNLGLGVTPSAWSTSTSVRAIQVGPFGVGSFWTYSSYAAFVGCGYYWNGTNRIYLTTGNGVSEYGQNGGIHTWYTAPSGTAGNTITFTQAMTLDASGNLLVGYTSSNGSYKLQVNSQIFATSAIIATSDARYKTNVTPISNGLSLVNKLNPVSFDWKEHSVHDFDTKNTNVGFLAQDVQEVLKDEIYLNSVIRKNEIELPDATKEEFLGLSDSSLIPILVKAIQEQQTLIQSLTERITALEGART